MTFPPRCRQLAVKVKPAQAAWPAEARFAAGRVTRSRSSGRRGFSPGQISLMVATVAILSLFLVLPLVLVLVEAFRKGLRVYWAAVTDPQALAALRLTLAVTAAVLVMNTVFGLAAAWCLAKFRFWGRNVLVGLIDLPISISPVIVGLLLVLVYGQNGWLGRYLEAWGIRVIFAWPGVVLATAFVTLPMVVKEVLPIMESQGSEEEEAARLLGAGGWQVFWRVTLPNIRWALLYGIILCTARSMGEFGAVSVVSGHIRGVTTTLPLHVEILYNEYRFSAAFAVASLLTGVGLIALVGKAVLEKYGPHVGYGRHFTLDGSKEVPHLWRSR